MSTGKDQAVTFLIRVTESLTHELRSLLATMKENVEMLEEELSLDDDQHGEKKRDLVNCVSEIRHQVMRGILLAGCFNTFVRAPDAPPVEIELNGLMRSVIRTCEPLAGSKKMLIKLGNQDESMFLVGNSVQLQLLILHCLEFLVNEFEAGTSVEVYVHRAGKGEVVVDFSASNGAGSLPKQNLKLKASVDLSSLQKEAAESNCRLLLGEAPQLFRLVLSSAVN